MKLTLGFSPCPNDTFLFNALVHKLIDTGNLEFEVILDDVEGLNEAAFEQKYDITKLSYHAFSQLTDTYQMLRSGSALGEGVGPLLITRPGMPAQPNPAWSIAVPGKHTTANLLLGVAYPELKKKAFLVFHEIEDAVLEGRFDAGVIIHENRFTYQDKGLALVTDLGNVWEKKFRVPIPLGGISVKRSMPEELKRTIAGLVRESVKYARQHPDISANSPFVLDNAQELSADILQKHIELYVNHYTVDLGSKGMEAVDKLLNHVQKTTPDTKVHAPWFVKM